jgi:hypothetical protein
MTRPTRRYHIPSALRASSLRLDVEDAVELLAAGALLIDVRRHDDPTAPLELSVRIPPDEIPGHVGRLPRDAPILLACA